MDDSPVRLPPRFPRDNRPSGPEAWVLERLRQVSARTWMMLGGVVVVLMALAIWALVAIWQALGDHAPALQQAAGGFLGQVTEQADPATAAAAAGLSGAVEQARGTVDQYAAQLDQVVPGASDNLRSAARAWLGPSAEPDEPVAAGESAPPGGRPASGVPTE